MLKLLSEEDELALVGDIEDVVVRLVGLVKLVEACHLANKTLRCAEELLLSFVLEQARLVLVQLAVGRLTAVLEEVEQGVQMAYLVQDFLCSVDPELIDRLLLDLLGLDTSRASCLIGWIGRVE